MTKFNEKRIVICDAFPYQQICSVFFLTLLFSTQLCINTAIVYMHRFYMFHSFTVFHRNSISTASLFLAAKVEEQPRKLEHVITVAHWCLKGENKLDTKSEVCAKGEDIFWGFPPIDFLKIPTKFYPKK